MVDLKVRLVPDTNELEKLKDSLLGRVKGKTSVAKGDQEKKSDGNRKKESSKLLTQLKNIVKFVGISAFIASLFLGIMKIMEPFFKLFNVILTLLFIPLIPILKPVLIKLAEMATNLAKTTGAFLVGDIGLGEFIAEAGKILIDGFLAIIPLILDVTVQILDAFVEALPPLIPLLVDAFVKVIEGLVAFVNLFVDAWISVIDAMIPFLPLLMDAFVKVIVALIPLIPPLITAFAKVIESMIPFLDLVVPSLVKVFVEVIKGMIPFIPEIVASLKELSIQLFKSLFAGLLSVLNSFFNPFSGFRNPDSGNDFIIRPNGQVIKADPLDTIIATKNPEALLGGGGGNFTFNITIPATINSDLDIRDVAEKIAEFSKDELSRRTTMVKF